MKGFPMMGNQSVQADQVKSQTSDGTSKQDLYKALSDNVDVMEYIQPGMAEYKEHQANMPQYKKGDSIGGHFNTTMKRIVHNMTGPSNPNLMGGGGGLDLIGGRGLAKGAMNAIKYILKSGGKTALKKGTKT